MELTDTPSPSVSAPATLQLVAPQPGAHVYDECLSIAGTVVAAVPPRTIEVFCDGEHLGSSTVFNQTSSGHSFRMLVRLRQTSAIETARDLQFSINSSDTTRGTAIGSVSVNVVPAHLAQRAYGDVVAPDRADVLHRENIYGYGPPLENPGAEIARLILEYLPARSSVLDLGCGAGAYGPPLLAAGHEWLGAETNPLCWSILERRGLPFQQLDLTNRKLPLRDEQFDASIAIEVLEHVIELDPLVAELARVTRDRLLVSVPNMEVIPYYAPLGVVPWHLLESTHVNFFTRASLRAALAPHFPHVEVFSYAEPPVRTADNLALHAHLFAIAMR